MPKKVEKAIEKEYTKKGYSAKKAKDIAYATMVKEGIWTPGKRKQHKPKRKK